MQAYKPKMGQLIKTDAGGAVDRGFIAHYQILAADAIAAAVDYIEASTVLGVAVTTIALADIDAQPPTPRVLSITGNAATVAGNVVITGTDANGDALTDTIAANGAATVLGAKAFASVTQIELPVAVAPADEISVGMSDKFGIPYLLPYSTVLLILSNATATTVAATSSFSATVLADNFIDPTAALNAAQVDVYLIV